MADLYLKNLESERRQLWATCRLKGLAKGTPERQRIVAIDEAIAAHKAKKAYRAPLCGSAAADRRGAGCARRPLASASCSSCSPGP